MRVFLFKENEMTIYTNSGLAMTMQSALGAAKTLTAISKASSGVFTGTHDFAAGDYVLLLVEGMKEVNNRVFQVLSVSTTVSFQLESLDGTLGLNTFTDFTSGTAQKVTFGTAISGVSAFTPSGGEPKFVDTTTVQDSVETQIVVGATARNYGLTFQWDPANAGQAAMLDAFTTNTPKSFKIVWPTGRFVLFYGSVGFSGMVGGESQGVTITTGSVALLGAPTYGL
jgi:hypothetical protein